MGLRSTVLYHGLDGLFACSVEDIGSAQRGVILGVGFAGMLLGAARRIMESQGNQEDSMGNRKPVQEEIEKKACACAMVWSSVA